MKNSKKTKTKSAKQQKHKQHKKTGITSVKSVQSAKAKQRRPKTPAIPPKPVKYKKKAAKPAAAIPALKILPALKGMPVWKIVVAAILVVLVIIFFVLLIQQGIGTKTGQALSMGEAGPSNPINFLIPVIVAIIICATLLVVGSKRKSELEALQSEEYELRAMAGKPETAGTAGLDFQGSNISGLGASATTADQIKAGIAPPAPHDSTQMPTHKDTEKSRKPEEEILREYIKQELDKGLGKQDIRNTLIQAEWDEKIVDDELNNLLPGDELVVLAKKE